MPPRKFVGLLLASGLLACQPSSPGPRAVAQAFWEASRTGDVDRARELVRTDTRAELKEPDPDSRIREFTLGDVTEEDGDALVETTLEGSGEQQIELTFPTVLVREEGLWKVDLDRTTREMTRALLGSSFEEIAEQMGEAMAKSMGEAMQGVAEGLQEGMTELADSLEAASDRNRDQ